MGQKSITTATEPHIICSQVVVHAQLSFMQFMLNEDSLCLCILLACEH